MPSEPAPLQLGTMAMARLLGMTKQGLHALVKAGVVAQLKRGTFDAEDAVQRYVAHRLAGVERRGAAPGAERLRMGKAEEQELKLAERRRTLIPKAEALEATDRIAGAYLDSIGGLPARLTRDPRERQRIEAICDAERQRLADHFAGIGRDLRAGRTADEAEPEGVS